MRKRFAQSCQSGRVCGTVHDHVHEMTNVNAAEQPQAARKRYQAQYRALYDEVLEILFQLDPIGVHATRTEKFVPELATLLPRLRDARCPEDVEQLIQEELRRWYGRRRLANQDPERLTDATIAICLAWNRFLRVSAH
jgi:hypothetical protein